MGVRELVILLLGLAIVAVVLKGLYVALQGRRGQIRLAIDKNIPRDVDLDSLELAELPGGGARTVDRSLEEVNRQNSALNSAQARAEALDLGEGSDSDKHIPVLMDAVELGEMKHKSRDAAGSPDGFGEQTDDDDPDSVLLDYDYDDEDDEEETKAPVIGNSYSDADPLKAVAPDYLQETVESDEHYPDDEDESTSEEEEYEPAVDEFAEENYDEDEQYQGSDDDELEQDELEQREEPIFDPLNTLDDFSMTAGERIGFGGSAAKEVGQSSLFDEMDEPAEHAMPKRRSLFSLFARKPKPQQEPEQEAEQEAEQEQEQEAEQEAELEREQEQIQEIISNDTVPSAGAEADEPIDEFEAVRATATPEAKQQSAELSEVIVINVMAKKGRVFAGNDLLHLLITTGLKFGDMSIFHKRLSNAAQGPIIFSIANILNPGTFDLNNMEAFTTLGVSLFLPLPSPINNIDAFEQMLEVAQQIRDALGGELKDDHRNGMTAQTIEHYRQRILDFELLRLKTAGARA